MWAMSVVISEIAIDCKNPMLVAKFWCEVLGYEVREEAAGLVTIGRRGDGSNEAVICFAQVPEEKSIKNRMHLDLRPQGSSQQDEVDRVLARGRSTRTSGNATTKTGLFFMTRKVTSSACSPVAFSPRSGL